MVADLFMIAVTFGVIYIVVYILRVRTRQSSLREVFNQEPLGVVAIVVIVLFLLVQVIFPIAKDIIGGI